MLPRLQHILVPTDLSGGSKAALDFAFELAVVNSARVDLLHVIEPIADMEAPEIKTFISDLEKRSETELESLSQRFSDANVEVKRKTKIGKRAAEIVNYSNENGVDLIVMNSHKVDLSNPNQPGLGTLSHQVSIFCQCPVMLVK